MGATGTFTYGGVRFWLPTESELRQALAEYEREREPSIAEEGAREVSEHLERRSRRDD